MGGIRCQSRKKAFKKAKGRRKTKAHMSQQAMLVFRWLEDEFAKLEELAYIIEFCCYLARRLMKPFRRYTKLLVFGFCSILRLKPTVE